jgi:hypothetical protein
MTDFRALCAELHAALEKRCETLEEDQLLDRSAAALRAALAQPEPDGPAVSNDREPASVAYQPTDQELHEINPECYSREIAAAALRAAADQVVPIPRLPYDSCCDVHAAAIRAELLAIAAELEGQ